MSQSLIFFKFFLEKNHSFCDFFFVTLHLIVKCRNRHILLFNLLRNNWNANEI